MRKSILGLGTKKIVLPFITRGHCLKAREGQDVDSLIFTANTSSTPFIFRFVSTTHFLSIAQQRLCSLTDLTLILKLTGSLFGSVLGSIPSMVSALPLFIGPSWSKRRPTLHLLVKHNRAGLGLSVKWIKLQTVRCHYGTSKRSDQSSSWSETCYS